MYNCNSRLNSFYDDKVRLKEKSTTLREYRDKNLERVREGTKKLREKENVKHPYYSDECPQGSMAMFTTNQAQNDDDHDIDHALIYTSTDAKDDPKEMREFVARAIAASGVAFKTEPEARTNAVTVWYEDGYHVDFAIYKVEEDWLGGETFYHAGPSWVKRDPRSITEWFNGKVADQSPSEDGWGVEVSKNQLRRIVRLMKFWAKSRATWSLPSGLVLSALATECYKKNDKRDDLSLLETLRAIHARLGWNEEVQNPTDTSISLITNDEHRKQISSLRDKLQDTLTALENVLKASKCTEEEARKAWGTFFANDWWSEDLKKSDSRFTNALTATTPSVDVDVVVFKRANSHRTRYEPRSHQIIPKGMNIRFTARPKFEMPFSVKWEVQNVGDEARWSDQDKPRPGHVDEKNPLVCNEASAYRGNHLMICEISKNGHLYRQEIPVRIR